MFNKLLVMCLLILSLLIVGCSNGNNEDIIIKKYYVNITDTDQRLHNLIVTGNLTIFGSILNVSNANVYNSINFSQTPSIDCDTAGQGQLFYSQDEKALSYKVNGICLQIGEEEYITVVNKLGKKINNGQVVYINGAQGNRPTVNLSDALLEHDSYSIGLATQDILNNAEGKITVNGLVHDLNTENWTAGTPLYLSLISGELTSIKLDAPYHANFIGFVVVQHQTQGIILVKPNLGFELSELHDVSLHNIYNGSILTYVNGIWVGNQTYWTDVYIPLVGAGLAGINDPDLSIFNSSTGIETRAREFQNNIDANEDEVFFTFQMPHTYKLGSLFEAHLHTSPDSSNVGNATFQLDCSKADINSFFNTTTQNVTIVYNNGTNELNKHKYNDFHSYFSCNVISCVMECRLKRDSSNVLDTYSSGIYVHAIDFHIEQDSFGSIEELRKY